MSAIDKYHVLNILVGIYYEHKLGLTGYLIITATYTMRDVRKRGLKPQSFNEKVVDTWRDCAAIRQIAAL